MTSSTPTLLIKSDVAAKVGIRADGSISFNILTDENHMEIYLAITGNQGGSGYFSPLPIAFSAIHDCIAGIPAGQVIIAKTFKQAAFSVSRNANAPGFIAAILRGIGLLGPAADAPHRHVVVGDWSAWKQEQLQAPAEPLPSVIPVDSASVTTEISNAGELDAEEGRGKRKPRKAGDKQRHPDVGEEPGYENPA